MKEALAREHLKKLNADWQITKSNTYIERTFVFKDFSEALGFVNTVAAIAEEQGHHPDITIFSYKNVTISLSTHVIGGISYNDFIVAAKIDVIKKE